MDLLPDTNPDTLTITLPPRLRAEVESYADRHDADVGWVLRRGARYMLDGEQAQEERLREAIAKRKRGPRR